jgi:hypothetical protein
MKDNKDHARSAYVHPKSSITIFLLWALPFLFMLRVLRQVVQHWLPQVWLPPFDSFQRGGLPYWLLLSVQLLNLTAMMRYSRQAQTGRVRELADRLPGVPSQLQKRERSAIGIPTRRHASR